MKIIVVFCILVLLYLIQKKRSLTEESFITIVNHTFRTPLTRIKWMSESLTADDIPRSQELTTATDISNSASRLLGVVDTLVGIKNIYSKASYELSAISLREILEEIVSNYRTLITEKKLSLKMPAFDDLPLLSVDTKKISLAISIVLENAISYSKEGGTVSIGAELERRMILIRIHDDGIGLSWKDKMNLFGRFYRGEQAKKMHTDGMGLGLSVAREIIRRHHGRLFARSKGRDRGTTFFIALPTTH